MYKRIFNSYQALSAGDKADLKRCNLSALKNSPAYFRVLKYTGLNDNALAQRLLFLMVGLDIVDATDTDTESVSVAQALVNAGVKEAQIIQITRSGKNSIEYLKRQLVRCKNINLESLGTLAQYWGENQRRDLLKQYILIQD